MLKLQQRLRKSRLNPKIELLIKNVYIKGTETTLMSKLKGREK